MAMPAIDLTGQRFGYLQVIERNGSTGGRIKCARWLCKCDCGSEVTRTSQYLRAKHRTHPRSCGCHHGNDTHKLTRTRPYRIWSGMKRRCIDVNDKDFRNYGARGVTVCDTWLGGFAAFWKDMAAGYSAKLTLDRIDNNGPYSPENCHWATCKEQSRNTRRTRMLDTPMGVMPLVDAAIVYGLLPVTLHARITRYKWDVQRALLTPAGKR
jgi:hypothetical protein